jgi:hypothetical protein
MARYRRYARRDRAAPGSDAIEPLLTTARGFSNDDAVLGHARPGEGLSRYSEGLSEEQRIEAVKAITLP